MAAKLLQHFCNATPFVSTYRRRTCRRVHGAHAHRARASTSQPQTDEHNAYQEAAFSKPEVVEEFCQPLPADIQQRLARIVDSVPGLGASSRVIDVGSGTGCLIPHLQARGVADILAVDLSAHMLQQLQRRFPSPGNLGNTPGVRTWHGDIAHLPAYQGPADAALFNAVFGNLRHPRDALLRAALLLRPGGHVAISHPLGRAWQAQLHAADPRMVPHELPGEQALQAMLADLPLQLVGWVDEPELYLALLQVPVGYALPGSPVTLDAPVVRGFGRGSRQLGVPTANLDPEPLRERLEALPNGVFFGWAQLDPPPGWPAADARVHKMVMNIGRRPTVNAGDEAPSVEVHVLHRYGGEEFYGCRMRAVAVGFLRPEIKFQGLDQLLARIRADIGMARTQLDLPQHEALQRDGFFDT